MDNDMLLLTTTGRVTGDPHTVPLLFLEDDGQIVLIASYGGRPHDPEWYRNLVDDPAVTVEVAGRGRERRIARTAAPEERLSQQAI